uniref:Putative lipophorin receptor n=1 Tax=Ixodes scapularis TaxID=6945 RepID=A0A4D5RTH0_IXOSC
MASCPRPQLVLLLALLLHGARSLPTSDLFPFGITQDQSLTKENDVSSAEVQLSHPITFYGTEYSTLYVNDNGLVSFLTDVPSFFSAEFPLQYPLIAPLYCDVDTRGTGRVFYRETQEESLLLRFTALVSSQYAAASFRARSLFVATWDAVGYYERKIDKVNTFQLVIGFDERDAYALLLYPEGGIQWIQADGKVPSLPDAKAQAGFMSGDKTRYTLLRGSGTDHVVNLDKMGNTGVPGQWLFRISGQDGAEPDSAGRSGSDGGGGTCASVRVPCPPSSVCVDYEAGFCCRCDRGSFGNGKNCIKDGAPQRVNGKLTGMVNELPIGAEVDFHSYVVTGDGRSYTALSRVAPVSLASDLRALLTLADVVGWLFALPQGTDAVNGFTLTGGEFNRTAEVRFKQTGHQVTIHEHYLGVDVFNMMKVNVEVRGSLPTISQGSKVTVDDYSQDFDHVSPGVVKAHLSNQFSLEGSSLPVEYTVDQTIVFSDCPHAPVGKKGLQRVQVGRNFIDLDTKDGIVRYAQTTKVSPVDGDHPCQGIQCGAHSSCVADGTGHRCQCNVGYETLHGRGQLPICVDVNECTSGQHNCHVHAECMNLEGSFACRCRPGYNGDGVNCQGEPTCASLRCDPAAECVQPSPDQAPQCRCPAGFTGDGSSCVPSATDCRQSPLMCDVNAQCEYNARTRSYGCRCRSGFRGDGVFCAEQSCLEADDCHPDAHCVYDRQVDAYFCACDPGFSGDGYVCYPQGRRPGCEVLHDCHPRAQCVLNVTSGQHQCRCVAGYRGDGYQCVQGPEGDCSRCAPTGGACVRDADGRPMCRCVEGYEGDGYVCRPLDECSTLENCDPHAQCLFDGRRYRCQCNDGYSGDGKVCEPRHDASHTGTPCNLVNRCGASAQCLYDPVSRAHRCVCDPGTQGDGYRCLPAASCFDDPSLCARNADCVRQPGGSPVCQCQPGFTGDGRACAPAPRDQGGYLLFGQGMSILQMPLAPTKGNPGKLLLMEQHQTVVGLASDCADGHIYWTDAASGTIRRAFSNGSSPETFRSGLRSPEGIAVDWASRNIFWTDSLDDTVEVASLDGAYHHVIVHDGLVNPRGIAVHPALGKVYWTDWDRSRPRIEACHMDGTGRSVLVEGDGLELPNMLALDLEHNDLCWTDAGRRTVECVNLSGGGRRTVYTPAQYPFGLALAAGKVFWTDWAIPFIHTVDRNGGTAEPLKLPLGGNGKLYGITAVAGHCPQLTNACSHQNGGCRHLCLPSGQWGRTCHCGGNSTACNEVNA